MKLKKIKEQLVDLNQKEQKIHKKLEELSTKDLYLEAYSRCKNIKFNHIPETCGEETEEVLRAFLQNELGHVYASTVEIQWVHQLGSRLGHSRFPALEVLYMCLLYLLQKRRATVKIQTQLM